MELAYIWIEEFRNFKNEGFNFSSAGNFSFDSHTNKLIYTANSNYTKDFFHPNISEIIGIVGKNGSGKSNILELINYVLRNSKSELIGQFFFITSDKKKHNNFICHKSSLFDTIINKTQHNIKQIQVEGSFKEFTNIYFSNVFDSRKYFFSPDVIDLSTNKFIWSSFGKNVHSHHQEEIRSQVQFITSKYFKQIQNTDLKIPETIILSSQLRITLTNKIRNLERERGIGGLSEFFKKYISRLSQAKGEHTFIYFTSFIIFIYYFFESFEANEGATKNSKLNYHLSPRELKSLNFIIKEILDGDYDIKELHEFLSIRFSEFLTKNNKEEKLREFLQRDLAKAYNNDWISKAIKKGRNTTGRLEFALNFSNKRCQDFIKSYFNAVGNRTIFNFEWGGISSGQIAFINLFSRFHSIIRRVRQDQVIICIDEGDLYFHPKWQLEFVDYLIKVLPNLFGERTLQIILTTHSPFLVSDLPKSSLIFLSNSSNLEKKVVNPDYIDLETFGANLHTLYTKTFFLDNGTISEFAYQKLKNLKFNLLEGNRPNIEDAKKIINQIGEPIIKKQFEKYLK